MNKDFRYEKLEKKVGDLKRRLDRVRTIANRIQNSTIAKVSAGGANEAMEYTNLSYYGTLSENFMNYYRVIVSLDRVCHG